MYLKERRIKKKGNKIQNRKKTDVKLLSFLEIETVT